MNATNLIGEYLDRFSVYLYVFQSLCDTLELRVNTKYDFLQNPFTPPDRPDSWLGCEKTARKYLQKFSHGTIV